MGGRKPVAQASNNGGTRAGKIWSGLISFFFHVCLFLRESVQVGKGQRERERETQNPKQAPGSELSAQSPTRGSNS